jgi:hypothetical protein
MSIADLLNTHTTPHTTVSFRGVPESKGKRALHDASVALRDAEEAYRNARATYWDALREVEAEPFYVGRPDDAA